VNRDRHRIAVVLAQGADILNLHRVGDQIGIGEGRHIGNRIGVDRYDLSGGGTGPHGGGAGTFAGRVVDLDVHKEHVAQVDDPDQQQQ
jgi:hypothetical protein